MKKRLLSAFLALAMVLTLLPVSAFAAAAEPATLEPGDSRNGAITAYYMTADDTTTGRKAGSWYWQDTDKTWYKLTTGCISGTSTSGTWYTMIGGQTGVRSGNGAKLIGNVGLWMDGASSWGTIDTFGQTLTINDDSLDAGNNTVTSLTITSTKTDTSGALVRGKVATKNGFVSTKSFKLSLTNVTTSSGVAFTNNNPGSVELDYAELGAITLTGVPGTNNSPSSGGTVTLKNGSSVPGTIMITHVSGTVRNGTNGKVTVQGGVRGGSTVTGAISVTQTSSNGNVVSVSGRSVVGTITVNQNTGGNGSLTSPTSSTVYITDAQTQASTITVNQAEGGAIAVVNQAVTGSLELDSTKNPNVVVTGGANVSNISAQGDGLKVNITNGGKATGYVKVFGRATTTLSETDKTKLDAPEVNVSGGFITGYIGVYGGNGDEGLEKEYTVKVNGGAVVTGTIDLPKAQITVDNNGEVKGQISLNSGTLNAGPTATLGNVELGNSNASPTYMGPKAVMTVKGFDNTIGAIKEATGNIKIITLTIPGTNLTANQNPYDHDHNRIDSVTVDTLANWTSNTPNARSSIQGGHYKQTLKNFAIDLLPAGISYMVEEETTGTYKDYCYSYWGGTPQLMNIMVTSIKTGIKEVTTIKAMEKSTGKAATDAVKVYLYTWDPRSVSNYNPADNAGMLSEKADLLLTINSPKNNTGTSIYLPSLTGTSQDITWYPISGTPSGATSLTKPTINTAAQAYAGGAPIAPTANIAYVANSISFKITKVTDVQTATGVNATVKATFANNTVTLSGLAQIMNGDNSAVIPLVLETDAMEQVYVNAVWDAVNKRLYFSDPTGYYPNTSIAIPDLITQTGGALRIETTDNSKIRVVESNTLVNLTSSSLTQYTLTVDVQGDGSGTAGADKNKGGMTVNADSVPNTQLNSEYVRKALAKAMTVAAGQYGPVDFSQSPAVLQAFGAYIARLNQTTLDGQLKKVQQDKFKEQWEKAHPGQTYTTQPNTLSQLQLDGTGYTKIAVVLYMDVKITSFESNRTPYTMTATMTPFARVEIQHKDWTGNPANVDTTEKDIQPVVVTAGTSLGTLDTTNVGQVTISLPDVSAVFNQAADVKCPAEYVHQNSTYVADVLNRDNKATGTTPPAPRSFTLLHTAANGAGFGKIVLSSDKPLAEVKYLKDKGDATVLTDWLSYTPSKLYSTVQAAVDDTKNGEKIFVDNHTYSNVEYPISVTGRARTFYIHVTGNEKITHVNTNSGYTITQPAGNVSEYTVQLTRDNMVKPVETTEDVTISVVAATNGSASVSASKAKTGDSITITARPATGYGVSSMTVRTDTGATVATTSTSTNVYTFKVPAGAKSITVTPAFAVTSNVNIVVNNTSSYGLASSNAVNNQARSGSTITITTRPYSGYQTSTVTAVANTGATVAVAKVAENTYTFVVPSGVTTVTVTPVFAAASHPFIDVASSHWANDAVTYVYNHGLMNGDGSSVIFNGNGNVTRGQLVTILYRLSNSPSSSSYNKFVDCNPSAYYAQAVTWAYNNGIVGGTGTNTFSPNLPIKRQDLATMLYNYNRYRGGSAAGTSNLAGYVDQNQIYSYALGAMQWCVGNGIVNGVGYNSLSPNGTATRYETATMMMRYCQNFLNMR